MTSAPAEAGRNRISSASWIADCALIFAAVAFLIAPLFRAQYLDIWSSIESTFIADARFISEHWPRPRWQPNWYCGTRVDYIYPPALRYGTAVLVHYVPGMLPVRAYHLYIAFFYCFGIAAVYLLVRGVTESRAAGSLAAAATALVSPSFLLVAPLRHDSPLWMPYRLNVLIRYGEGPHMTAVAWLPLALLFSYRALEQWRPVSLAIAAVCCAAVVSNNFYGATSLAMLFPVLLWSVFITHSDRQVLVRAASIALLAYGLTAFWMVPSYVKITLDNMRLVAVEGNVWSRWVAVCAAAIFLSASSVFARRRREYVWVVFLTGSAFLFLLNVVGNHYFGFRVIGEPHRQYPELDLLLILLFVETIRLLWHVQWQRPLIARTLLTLLCLGVLAPSWQFIRKSHSLFVQDRNPQNRVEYKLQDWVARNLPRARVLVAGSVRFWFNVWHDRPQLGGGSDQGILNNSVVAAQWSVLATPDVARSIQWLQIMGVDAVVVNGPKSQEIYHDYKFPDKFAGSLPVLYADGAGNVVYRVPRRSTSLARVVDTKKHAGLPSLADSAPEAMQAWYDATENGSDAFPQVEWSGTDSMRFRASLQPGQSVWLQETFDPNWHATVNNRPVPVRSDKLGFMLVDAPPGSGEIQLKFEKPLEARVGTWVTAISAAAILWLVAVRSHQTPF